jgi:phage shock protein PspC (stress-responsive transcriptional regulator)
MDSVHDSFRRQGLVRPRSGRVLGGVCAGLGRRFGLDPWPARLLFVLILFVIPGSQILIYPVLWILMPPEVAPASDYPPAGYPGSSAARSSAHDAGRWADDDAVS